MSSQPQYQLSRDQSGSSKKKSPSDVEAKAIPVDTHDVFDEEDSGVDPVYQAKARLLNDAFQEIGMGKYQVRCANSQPFELRACGANRIYLVVPIQSHRFWMVLVRQQSLSPWSAF